MSEIVKIYHGSENIVKEPLYKGGSEKNDFGSGFYCTYDLDSAKEWGAQRDGGGFANEYTIDIEGLKIFDLTEYDYLVWVSVLLKNRDVGISTPLMKSNVEFMLERYYPREIEDADIVVGYRADDSYFSWAKEFLDNKIDIDQLEESIYLNDLGLQFFLQSEESFRRIHYVKFHEVENMGYYNRKIGREKEANRKYMEVISKNLNYDGIFVSDLKTIDPILTNKKNINDDNDRGR